MKQCAGCSSYLAGGGWGAAGESSQHSDSPAGAQHGGRCGWLAGCQQGTKPPSPPCSSPIFHPGLRFWQALFNLRNGQPAGRQASIQAVPHQLSAGPPVNTSHSAALTYGIVKSPPFPLGPTHTHTHTHTYTHTHTHTHTHARTHAHARTRAHAHAHTHTYTHTDTHSVHDVDIQAQVGPCGMSWSLPDSAVKLQGSSDLSWLQAANCCKWD